VTKFEKFSTGAIDVIHAIFLQGHIFSIVKDALRRVVKASTYMISSRGLVELPLMLAFSRL
jgi:hypothetical protein